MKKDFEKIRYVITNIIEYSILIPLVITTIMLIYQLIKYPSQIPDIFGYKMFIVINDIHKDVKIGDLIFVKEEKIYRLRTNDVIAVRSSSKQIIIKNINNITRDSDNKYLINISDENLPTITEKLIEGKLVKRVPKVGMILYQVQRPINVIKIVLCILILGGIQYLIARRLDINEMKKMQKNE